jgi:MFS family permease
VTTEQPPLGKQGLPYEVWILVAVGFLIAVGFGVMVPALPIFAASFGVGSFLIGLVISSLAVLRLSTMPLSSWLLRFVGARELLIVGCGMCAATTFMIGVAHSYWGVLLWRGLSGFGSALFGVSSMALLFASAPAHMRGRANSMYAGGFVLGGVAGPAIGGLLSAYSLQLPFFVYAISLVIGAVVLVIALPRTSSEQRRRVRSASASLGHLIADRRFRAACAVNFAHGWQAFGVRTMLVPLFVVGSLGRSMTWVGLAFAISAIAQAACLPLAGWGTDRFGRRAMMLVGSAITATVSVGLALTGSYFWLVVLLCFYAIGASASGSASQALLADTVPPGTSAGLAVFQMSGDIGVILGPLAAGVIIDAFSLPWAWVGGAVLIVIGLALTWPTPAQIQPPVGPGAD